MESRLMSRAALSDRRILPTLAESSICLHIFHWTFLWFLHSCVSLHRSTTLWLRPRGSFIWRCSEISGLRLSCYPQSSPELQTCCCTHRLLLLLRGPKASTLAL